MRYLELERVIEQAIAILVETFSALYDERRDVEARRVVRMCQELRRMAPGKEVNRAAP